MFVARLVPSRRRKPADFRRLGWCWTGAEGSEIAAAQRRTMHTADPRTDQRRLPPSGFDCCTRSKVEKRCCSTTYAARLLRPSLVLYSSLAAHRQFYFRFVCVIYCVLVFSISRICVNCVYFFGSQQVLRCVACGQWRSSRSRICAPKFFAIAEIAAPRIRGAGALAVSCVRVLFVEVLVVNSGRSIFLASRVQNSW